MAQSSLKEAQKIFFAGIGGIGISALARILHSEGKRISGSDLVESELTQKLQKEGIEIEIGHRESNLSDDTEILVYSAAVPENNPERQRAKKISIQELSYPQAVGELAKNYKVIAVAGTNGKTTTTAMIAWILEQVFEDPTAIVGSEILAWQSNARFGRGQYLVLEADEYRRAFLNYEPDLVVITNIAADHLDYFQDLEDIKKAFGELIGQIKRGGVLIYNQSDANTVSVAGRFDGSKIGFKVQNFKLRIPGGYNQANAQAAAAACESLGIKKEDIVSALGKFGGTWRRFEKVGRVENTDIISDYAHHPEAVTAALKTVAEIYTGNKVLAVFQPHQHNRTKKLFREFVRSLCESPVDNFIITEIFDVAGREESDDQDIDSGELVREITKCGKMVKYAGNLKETEREVRARAANFDAIIFMGAGDIYLVANKLIK